MSKRKLRCKLGCQLLIKGIVLKDENKRKTILAMSQIIMLQRRRTICFTEQTYDMVPHSGIMARMNIFDMSSNTV